jgi:hypothetical protein
VIKLGKSRNIKIIKCIVSIVIAFLIIVSIFLVYVSDYYHTDSAMVETFIENKEVEKSVLYDGAISYKTNDSDVGFIFYPGGKVEFSAYEPLMYELALNGITCILIEMPFNLAVFNVNAADKAMDYFPNISSWYIGGHSLGGTIAATYLEKNYNKFDGLILLGSYSTSNLKNTDLKVLSIYGSEDKVMNKEKYLKNKDNLPNDFTEVVIEGGCHAYFGMYGKQDGDGNPSLSANEQISLTAKYIQDFIMKE